MIQTSLPLLFLLGGLASLVTLLILLFKPNRPAPLRIPTFQFGAQTASRNDKLSVRPPPWLLWLCILLFSVGCYLAYWPTPRAVPDERRESAIVWVDTSFSAVMGRNVVDSGNIAKQVFQDFKSVYVLTPKRESVELTLVNTASQLSVHLEQELRAEPTVGNLDFDTEGLKAAMQNHALTKPTLIVLSDGQHNTLSELSSLKESFSEFRLFETGIAENLNGVLQEIIPSELLTHWGIKTDGVATDAEFTKFDARYNIPSEARPHLNIESIGQRNVLSVARGQGALFPLVSGCRFTTPASWELNPFADIDSLTTYLRSTFRQYNCREGARLGRSPWMYRQGSLWIVPATEDILNTMSQRLWLPDDFRTETDILVYVASPELVTASQAYLVRQAVQLDTGNNVQIPIDLLPEPPPLTYEFQERQTQFEVVFESANKVPLAFKLKDAPIYWLRTYATMVNGELGRSAAWSQFWIDVAQNSVVEQSVYLRVVTTLKEAREYDVSQQKQFNTTTLRFDKPPHHATLGLRLHPTIEGAYVLFGVPPSERARLFYTASEFSSVFGSSEKETTHDTEGNAPFRAKVGATLAFLAVLLFWWLKRGGRDLNQATQVVLLLVSLCATQTATAQIRFSPRRLGGSDKNYAVPFRISWCDATIPESVQNRYQQLRSLLLSRGTIVLPATLLAGRCAPLQSEIWWTNDALSMQQQVLASHIAMGGVFIVEGQPLESKEGEVNASASLPRSLFSLSDPSIGLSWERPSRRGMLYRSFYLLHHFDGCLTEQSFLLSLRKKQNAQAPVGLVTSARFLTSDMGRDCFEIDDDFRSRSFINLMYALFSTDYKEDQMQLPELLKRIRRLGIEP